MEGEGSPPTLTIDQATGEFVLPATTPAIRRVVVETWYPTGLWRQRGVRLVQNVVRRAHAIADAFRALILEKSITAYGSPTPHAIDHHVDHIPLRRIVGDVPNIRHQ